MPITALEKEGVGIVALGQHDAASEDAVCPETMGELLRGLLAGAAGIGIEAEIHGARAVAQC